MVTGTKYVQREIEVTITNVYAAIATQGQVGTTSTCPRASPFPLARGLVKVVYQNASTSE